MERRPMSFRAGEEALEGDLTTPDGARGVVIVAHGSGSSQRSPRNRRVAELLNEAKIATLLIDLLSESEAREDQATGELRFDIALLSNRLRSATQWLARDETVSRLSLGYFGASSGAAAALVAASELSDRVGAVVSRGGRPDLAADDLGRVRAATLLIVGESDTHVLDLNRAALELLPGEKELAVIPGATHLFEEPGALDQVAKLAGDWFVQHLA